MLFLAQFLSNPMSGLRTDMACKIKGCPTLRMWDTMSLISLTFMVVW